MAKVLLYCTASLQGSNKYILYDVTGFTQSVT